MNARWLGLLVFLTLSTLSILSTSTWATKPAWLPCDPDKMAFKPTISVGEDETAPPIRGEKESAEGETYFLSSESPDRLRRIREAGEGTYFLGLQSLYLNEAGQKKRRIQVDHWSKARIFGLDHPFPGALAALIRAFAVVKESPADKPAKASKTDGTDADSGFTRPSPKLLQAKELFLRSLADNPHLRDSWISARKARPTIPNAREEAVAKIFDQVTADPEIDQEKLIGGLIKTHPWYDRLPFLDLIAGVERGYASLGRKLGATAKFSMPPTLPGMMEKYFRLDGDTAAAVAPLDQAVARWRGLFVASSVAALVCKASESSKHIVALVEPDQVAQLKKLLKESFGKSIKIADAKEEDPAEEEIEAEPSPKSSAKPSTPAKKK